ncbi:MAG: sensor histidine kinase N-terminal domain-containing protein [Burkholderiaceae bacterium]|nr:sensor histidine kinase N-terminal domain-containing protein [Burkholderiaceae bacterium]
MDALRWLNLDALHRLSLRRTLLLALLPGMMAVVGAELWLTWRTAVDAANAAYDRSLLGAIKAMDANISTASGGLGVELPYAMLEFFELTASGQVFYRVATEDGLVEIGNADLPAPRQPLVTGRPQFDDAVYYDTPVRLGSYARVLGRPLAGRPTPQRVVIQIAETLESRQDFTRALVIQSVARDLLLVLAATVMLVLAVAWALRPLARLRGEVAARNPDDLTPVSTGRIPADVRPLVEAINHHIERNREQTEARRRFVDDASHQLRTPLATLATQVGFALRETEPASQQEALRAIKVQLDETVRQTNQMLALARTDSAALQTEAVNLAALAEEQTRSGWADARARGIDLGFDGPGGGASWRVQAQAALLREALANLLHNALRHTPRGGQVTVKVRREYAQAVLTVLDTGAGMTDEQRARAGERFFRAGNTSLPGSGLGLAIVRSICERHGGSLQVDANPDGRGLAVSMRLPLVPSSAA